jgi:hypothetical protein
VARAPIGQETENTLFGQPAFSSNVDKNLAHS